jgi:hypothetical protein
MTPAKFGTLFDKMMKGDLKAPCSVLHTTRQEIKKKAVRGWVGGRGGVSRSGGETLNSTPRIEMQSRGGLEEGEECEDEALEDA